MFKLSIHTLIVSSLLLSATAFAIGEEIGERPETAIEKAQRDSALESLKDPTKPLSSQDLADIARRFNRSWKTGSKSTEKVVVTKPILESSFLDAKGFNKALAADLVNTSPEHIKAVEGVFSGLNVEIPKDINSKDKATREAAQQQVDAQRISARNYVTFLELFSPEQVKEFDPAKTRAEMKIYKVSATKSLVGFEHFAILAKIDAIIAKQEMTPHEAMEKGIEAWLIHLKHNPADVAREAKEYIECTPVGAAG
jgi:hypothetical protein